MTVPANSRIEPPAREADGRGRGREARASGGRAKGLIQFFGLTAIIITFACSLPGRAQTAPGTQNKNGNEKPRSGPAAEGTTIHVASPLVVVPFTVTAPSGDFIYDLNESDVRVLDNGLQQQIRHFGMATQPVAAVIVVQANRKAGPFLKSVHPLGPLFSSLLLGSKGRAAVLTYSDKVALLETFSGDPLTLNKTLQEIQPEGSKARLNDALVRAVRMLSRQVQAERRVIIVFSDGLNRGSAARGEQVVRAACDANVQIYALRFQPGREAFENGIDDLRKVIYPAAAPPAGPASARGGQTVLDLGPVAILTMKVMRAQLRKNMLAAFSDYTGGRIYTPFKKHSFQDTLQQIALDINSEYVLTYVPDTLKEEGFHQIQLEVSRPRLKVHTRSGYFYGVKAM
jgi:VWFA-related protein